MNHTRARVLTVRLFTKTTTQCSLCEAARDNIRLAARRIGRGIEIEEVDIEATGNQTWEDVFFSKFFVSLSRYDKYMFDVPVGHVEGKEIFRHRITPDRMVEIFKDWEKGKLGEE